RHDHAREQGSLRARHQKRRPGRRQRGAPVTGAGSVGKVVVTGGAGFIGANLCAALSAHDAVDEVVAFDNLSSGDEGNLRGVPAELVKGDILDGEELDAAMAGARAVVHLAARPSVPRSIADPKASHEANATGTLQVLEAARRAGGI